MESTPKKTNWRKVINVFLEIEPPSRLPVCAAALVILTKLGDHTQAEEVRQTLAEMAQEAWDARDRGRAQFLGEALAALSIEIQKIQKQSKETLTASHLA